MVQSDIITDNCSLTNHHPHAVIDKEAAANLGSRVYLNTCYQAGNIGKNAGQQAEPSIPQVVGHAMH